MLVFLHGFDNFVAKVIVGLMNGYEPKISTHDRIKWYRN